MVVVELIGALVEVAGALMEELGLETAPPPPP